MAVVIEVNNLLKICKSPIKHKKLNDILIHLELLNKYMVAKQHRTYSTNEVYYEDIPNVMSQFEIVASLFRSILPEYDSILIKEQDEVCRSKPRYSQNKISNFLLHCADLIKIDLVGEKDILEGNIYLGIEEKLKRADKSARENNAEGLFSSLHTVIELLLKDKLGIGLTIEQAKLGKVIGICLKYNLFGNKTNILKQLDEKVCKIDNRIKHTGYNATGTEMSNAYLATTQAVRTLENETIVSNQEAIDSINDLLTGKSSV